MNMEMNILAFADFSWKLKKNPDILYKSNPFNNKMAFAQFQKKIAETRWNLAADIVSPAAEIQETTVPVVRSFVDFNWYFRLFRLSCYLSGSPASKKKSKGL